MTSGPLRGGSLLRLVAIGLIVVLASAACSTDDDSAPEARPEPPADTDPEPTDPPADTPGQVGDASGAALTQSQGTAIRNWPKFELFLPLIGTAMEEFTESATDLGYTVRVLRLDGVEAGRLDDIFSNRVNVSVVDGTVEGILGFW